MPGALNWIYDTANRKWVPVKSDPNGVQEVYDPKVYNSLVVYEGTATADGPNASTITDTVLAGKPDFNGQLVVITSGDYKGQTRDIDQATNIAGGQVHAAAAFGDIIVSGVTFVILSIRPTTAEVAAIEATLGTRDTAAATGPVSNVKAAIAYLKELVTGLALDGSAPHSYDYTKATVPGWLHGFHMIRRILFVIPEAVGSITDHNTAIRAELDKLGLVITITQADALTYPDYESITLTVLGSPLAGTAWTTSNLAHIKAIFGLPVICVDALTAVYLKMGTDGGNAATKTVLNAIANIEASILGAGIDDTAGLAAGANTVADAGVTFSTLDMSDADITKVWYAYESVNADTDVILGEIRKTMPDSTPGKDLDGADVPGTLAFYGCAYSMDGLNTLGKAVLHLLVDKLLHSSTAGLAVLLSGEVGNLAAIIGNRATPAAAGPVTTTDKLMAYLKQLVTELIVVDGIVDTITGHITADYGATEKTNINHITADYAAAQKQIIDDWADAGRLDAILDAIKLLLDTPANFMADLTNVALEATLATVDGIVDTINTNTDSKAVGKLQVAATTIELNQGAGAKDLFTGTDQDVVVEKLVIRIPADVTGGNMDSLSIQTDDTTAQVFIDATAGAKANLTEQAQLSWTGAILLKATKKIQLTIAGAATGIACDCDVIAECRAVVAGGYLA